MAENRPGGRVSRRSVLAGAAASAGLAATAPTAFAAGARNPPSDARAAGPRSFGSARGSRSCDVVIVGAGLAGLSAAWQLVNAEPGLDVVVVEARDRVGGRTLNHPLDANGFPGRVIEVGGQWVGPLPDEPATSSVPGQAVYRPQDQVFALARSLGIGTFKTYNEGDYVDYSSVTGRTTYSSATRIPTDPGSANAALALGELNDMAKSVPLDAPWTAKNAASWDAQTAETWMRSNLLPPGQDPGSPAYALVNLAFEAVFAAEPRDVSLLHTIFYIASAGNLDNLVDTADGAQDSRFVGGSQAISIALANRLGDRVLLGSPVRAIAQGTGTVSVSGDGFSIDAQHAVVAVPPTLAGRIVYSPTLAEISGDGGLRDQLTQRVPMGTTIKVQCLYDRPFWRSAGLAGQATSDTGPVKITFDNTPYPDPGTPDASPGVLIGFIEGADGRRWGRQSRAARFAAVVECFARYFGGEAKDVRGGIDGYVEMLWAREEFTGGCYGGLFPTGVWTSYGPALRAPVGRVHWAGTETSPVWNGYMDGAVRSGKHAATEVLTTLRGHAPTS